MSFNPSYHYVHQEMHCINETALKVYWILWEFIKKKKISGLENITYNGFLLLLYVAYVLVDKYEICTIIFQSICHKIFHFFSTAATAYFTRPKINKFQRIFWNLGNLAMLPPPLHPPPVWPLFRDRSVHPLLYFVSSTSKTFLKDYLPPPRWCDIFRNAHLKAIFWITLAR